MYLNNKLNDIMNYILKNKKHVAILLGLIVLFTLIVLVARNDETVIISSDSPRPA